MSSHPLRVPALLLALVVSAGVFPSSLHAQRSPIAPDQSAALAFRVDTPTPRLAVDSVVAAGRRTGPSGVRKLAQPSPFASSQRRDESAHIGAGANLAMMGTGATALVVGLMVGGTGGTMVAVGGGALGLLGLYRYLR